LALFFKLLCGNKLLRHVTLDAFSQQIAAGFSSKGKRDFKAHNIKASKRKVAMLLTDLLLPLTEEKIIGIPYSPLPQR